MVSYRITFYPGMTLPRPYFVSAEKPTTDGQALLDILADRLSEEGADGLFDDEEGLPDDMVSEAGNSGRRLITGGCLDIRPVEKRDICSLLREACGTDNPTGTVRIGFANPEGYDDQTEFDDVQGAEDLAELWWNFCQENNFAVTDINYCE